LFFFDGELIFCSEYWDQGDYQGTPPPVDQFVGVAKNIESRFFTMDVAKRKNGEWLIVELGDGQVAGLPENANVDGFYEALAAQWSVRRMALKSRQALAPYHV
jgi:hypothetical protein